MTNNAKHTKNYDQITPKSSSFRLIIVALKLKFLTFGLNYKWLCQKILASFRLK